MLRDSDGEKRGGGDPLFVEIADGRDKGPFTSSKGLQKMLFTGERFSSPRQSGDGCHRLPLAGAGELLFFGVSQPQISIPKMMFLYLQGWDTGLAHSTH